MNKAEAREMVRARLLPFARPDSRSHLNFFEDFIPDFEGSEDAAARLADLPAYREAQTIFITPDNCLEAMRARAMHDRKQLLVTTGGIRRGFVELRPEDVAGKEEFAALLDGMERVSRYISLAEMRQRYGHIEVMVTGASAVSHAGIRFGKGHGYFDLEWAMLYQMGLVDARTVVIAVVHDTQVVELELAATPFDTVCDLIITPGQTITIRAPQKPTVGVLWDRLEADMLDRIPPLRELYDLTHAP